MIVDVKGDQIKSKDFGDYSNLISYLSQVVTCKTDEKIEQSHKDYEKSKDLLSFKKKEMFDFIKEYSILEKEYSRENVLNRILKTITTLKEEGLLVGPNVTVIKKLLTDINEMSLEKLIKIESRLIRYLP